MGLHMVSTSSRILVDHNCSSAFKTTRWMGAVALFILLTVAPVLVQSAAHPGGGRLLLRLTDSRVWKCGRGSFRGVIDAVDRRRAVTLGVRGPGVVD